MEPFTYARRSEDQCRYTLYVELGAALYSAILAVDQQRPVPLGIRQGRRILFRHSQLVALHAEYATPLAAGDHWGVVQALEMVAAQANAPACHLTGAL
jgi:hypothetical protein